MAGIMDDLSAVRTQLSKCSTFRTFTGTATEALALARVGYFHRSTTTLPMAVVCHGDWISECDTVDQTYIVTPQVLVQFIKSVTGTDTVADAFVSLATSVDAIMAQMLANTTWRILSWQPEADTPQRTPSSAGTDIVTFTVVINGNQHE